jgi:hypothetical protein
MSLLPSYLVFITQLSCTLFFVELLIVPPTLGPLHTSFHEFVTSAAAPYTAEKIAYLALLHSSTGAIAVEFHSYHTTT